MFVALLLASLDACLYLSSFCLPCCKRNGFYKDNNLVSDGI